MKLDINMVTEFGEFLADGHVGNHLMSRLVASVWSQCDSILFDFTGVHNLTDSFVNATFGNMAEEHGDEFTKKVRMKGCSPVVKSFLSIAIGEGMKRHQQRNLS